MSVIFNIQNKKFDLKEKTVAKLNTLLKINFSEDILLFPNYTIDWFWGKDFLEQDIVLHDKKIKLYEAIANEEVFNNNIRVILNTFIDNLPSILKYKIGTDSIINKIYLKHNIMRSILYFSV